MDDFLLGLAAGIGLCVTLVSLGLVLLAAAIGWEMKKHQRGEKMSDLLKRINEITLKIGFHENRIALHKSAINKLRKEKSLLMAKGEWVAEKTEEENA